jgi:hypothetical protein
MPIQPFRRLAYLFTRLPTASPFGAKIKPHCRGTDFFLNLWHSRNIGFDVIGTPTDRAAMKRCGCAFHKLDSNERVVKSTQVRHPRDRSGLLDETAKRGILVQRKVRARLIVIASVRSKNAS